MMDMVKASSNAVEVYTPPANFQVIDRGAAETFTFNEIGDTFEGIFEYATTQTDDKTGEIYPQLMFTAVDGTARTIFPGGTLIRAATQFEKGDWLRITYDKDVPITGQRQPMKSYVVERGLF
jgi:hypothetical protein